MPPVGLTYIFCGHIKEDGTAEGFHSRPNKKDPVCAKADSYKYSIGKPAKVVDCYATEKVYNWRLSKWIGRTNAPISCFFPSAWTIAGTVTELRNIYTACRARLHATDNRICKRNHNNQDYDVIVLLNKAHTHIVSGYVTPRNGEQCTASANC